MRWVIGLCVIASVAVFWVVTAPEEVPEEAVAGLSGDVERGQRIYLAAGCGSCHVAPGAADDLVLAGGQRFETEFGVFVAPNISPSEAGIGGWSLAEFATALVKGVSPEGQHYYPAFPYAAYGGMALQDVADLKAYLDALPADLTPSAAQEAMFPLGWRRLVGGWKWLFLDETPVIDDPDLAAGRYLVEVLGHCGECHTERNLLGGIQRDKWLAGAPAPHGKGRVPAIDPAGLGWDRAEIVAYLESGFTPDYDVVGGSMAKVQENLARLPAGDREAIADYLLALPR